MTDIQAWLDSVATRLDAVKREPAQEERDYESESQAWSDLYEHAPTDLTRAHETIRSVLNLHQPQEFVGHNGTWLRCTQGCPEYPCATRRKLDK